jgi:hypothetical protein
MLGFWLRGNDEKGNRTYGTNGTYTTEGGEGGEGGEGLLHPPFSRGVGGGGQGEGMNAALGCGDPGRRGAERRRDALHRRSGVTN